MPIHHQAVPPHFLVFVPGLLGSRLRRRGDRKLLWPGSSVLSWLPPGRWLDELSYSTGDMVPDGIVDEVVFVPPWVKQQCYGRLIAALERFGYHASRDGSPAADPALYVFAYDWRQDNRQSAKELARAVRDWSRYHPGAKAWIIAHSMGGLVSRWFIEKLGGEDLVQRLFLVASPWDGAPMALQVLFHGYDVFLRKRLGLFDVRGPTRDFLRTLPSAYQLLPWKHDFLWDVSNQPVDCFAAQGWLPDPERQRLLADGRTFGSELGLASSVQTLCLFGRKQPTLTRGTVQYQAGAAWQDITWNVHTAGDGTVPERSAVHPGAATHFPVAATHGDVYANPAAWDVLEWALLGQYQAATTRAAVSMGDLQLGFRPDKNTYEPGESMVITAAVHRAADRQPVSDASVQIELVWQENLPGSTEPAPAGTPLATTLVPSHRTDIHFEGTLMVPRAEGYYRLLATVKANDAAPLCAEELVAVESASD